MKKAVVIYESKYGNTERVAKSIAKGIKVQKVKVDLASIGEAKVNKLADYDLLVVGGPTQMHGMSQSMKDFLIKLEGANLAGKKAYAFDTKVARIFAGSAAKGIEQELKKLGMKIVMPYSSAIVKGREGPLAEGQEEKFKSIGAELAKSLAE